MSQPAWKPAAEAGVEDAVAPAPQRRLGIRFTGSGSEYFRIWIVNLLLTIVTLTLYHPWAKVRRLRYFYGNTLVGGQPLDFHGQPRAMLRGYLLVGVLALLYSVADGVSPVAGLVAFVAVAALWPALLLTSMQFRLANTSWRGWRFRFTGTMGGAYRAVLPLLLPLLAVMASVAALPEDGQPPAQLPAIMGAVVLAVAIAAPWQWWRLKKFQHDHYAFGPFTAGLRCGPGAVYAVVLKTGALAVLCAVAIVATTTLLVVVAGAGSRSAWVMWPVTAALLASSFVLHAYIASHLQNLIWSRTAGDGVRFDSRLHVRPLFLVVLRNWLLLVLTLGLYWPFAKVALYRLRVEAVRVVVPGNFDDRVNRSRPRAVDATGDAAADLVGVDLGL